MSEIITANSASFNSGAFSAELASYVAGYKLPEIEKALEFITPTVNVPSKRFEYAKFGKGAFLIDTDDERQVAGEFKKITIRGDVVQAKLAHRGLTLIIDKDELTSNFEQMAVERLKRRLLMNEYLRAQSLLSTIATSSNKIWSASASGKSNPDGDLRALISSVADDSGLRANRILLGETAWLYRYVALADSTATAAAISATFTAQQLAQSLMIDEVSVNGDRYQDNVNSTTKKNLLAATKVYAFNSSKGISQDDPSTIKRFVKDGKFNVYVVDKGATREITLSHYSLLAQTGVGAAKALNISQS